MVLAVKPVMELVKLPVPVPSVVWLLLVVGFCEVLQQMPLAVMLAPPSEVMLPPPVAVVWVMLLTLLVVTVGKLAVVVKLTSLPYEVSYPEKG